MKIKTTTPARDMFEFLTETICTAIMNSEDEKHAFITGLLMSMACIHYDAETAKIISDKLCQEFEKEQKHGYNGAQGVELIKILAKVFGLLPEDVVSED